MNKMKAFIDPEKCDRSPMCPAMRFCPQQAIYQKEAPGGRSSLGAGRFGGGISTVDPSKCTGCTICMRYCPRGAIKMQEAV